MICDLCDVHVCGMCCSCNVRELFRYNYQLCTLVVVDDYGEGQAVQHRYWSATLIGICCASWSTFVAQTQM